MISTMNLETMKKQELIFIEEDDPYANSELNCLFNDYQHFSAYYEDRISLHKIRNNKHTCISEIKVNSGRDGFIQVSKYKSGYNKGVN